MAVIDESGMAVSLTTTVNLYWGSQVMTEDGIILFVFLIIIIYQEEDS